MKYKYSIYKGLASLACLTMIGGMLAEQLLLVLLGIGLGVGVLVGCADEPPRRMASPPPGRLQEPRK